MKRVVVLIAAASFAICFAALVGMIRFQRAGTSIHDVKVVKSDAVITPDLSNPIMLVRRSDDFEVTGDGSNKNWNLTSWQALTEFGEAHSGYKTKAKMLYSQHGIYYLFDCEDDKLSCTKRHDNDLIYNEDVVEVFVWPNESHDLYFEYDLSPLGTELPLMVANNQGDFMGWLPWQYIGRRKVHKATAVRGGSKAPHAVVNGWTAEIFVPFALFEGFADRPTSGTRWRANLYRLDYDNYPESRWGWSPKVGRSFHNFHQFGTIEFE
jgi:hypothetical protein